jgi:hypothetical protein
MTICEPEVARRNLDQAKQRYDKCLQLAITAGAEQVFREARDQYNIALSDYLESRRAWGRIR